MEVGVGGRVWGELSVSGLLGFPGYRLRDFLGATIIHWGRVSNQKKGYLCIVSLRGGEGKGREGGEGGGKNGMAARFTVKKINIELFKMERKMERKRKGEGMRI